MASLSAAAAAARREKQNLFARFYEDEARRVGPSCQQKGVETSERERMDPGQESRRTLSRGMKRRDQEDIRPASETHTMNNNLDSLNCEHNNHGTQATIVKLLWNLCSNRPYEDILIIV